MHLSLCQYFDSTRNHPFWVCPISRGGFDAVCFQKLSACLGNDAKFFDLMKLEFWFFGVSRSPLGQGSDLNSLSKYLLDLLRTNKYWNFDVLQLSSPLKAHRKKLPFLEPQISHCARSLIFLELKFVNGKYQANCPNGEFLCKPLNFRAAGTLIRTTKMLLHLVGIRFQTFFQFF